MPVCCGRRAMPRDGAIIFGDHVAPEVQQVPAPRSVCPVLPDQGAWPTKLIDWLDFITADCPKKEARQMNDHCGARCPDLSKVI